MINVREATRKDMETIADFQLKLAHETELVTLDKTVVLLGLEAMFDDPSKGKYFVAEINGEIAACHSITYEWSEWRNGVVWWIQSVYVAEKFRKSGVFKVMFEALKQKMHTQYDVRGIRLYVDNTNSRAQQVYRALGMNGEHYSVFELMR
jgi:GNAT superfamily N-acetyltransferase